MDEQEQGRRMNEYLNFQLGHHPETFMQVKADSPEGTEESSSLPVSISIYLCGRRWHFL